MRLTAEQLGMLQGLGKTPLGLQLHSYISAEIEDCNELLRNQTGEELLRTQGRARFLDAFAKALRGPSAQQVPRLHPRPPSISDFHAGTAA